MIEQLQNQSNLVIEQLQSDLVIEQLQRDLEIWWKHGRLSQGDNALFPVVYYLLGGGGGLPVTRGAKKTVLALYR